MRNKIQKLFLVNSIEGAIFLSFQLSIPRDPRNALIFGYSFERLILVSVLLLIEILLIWTIYVMQQNQSWANKICNTIMKIIQNEWLQSTVLTILSWGIVLGIYFIYLWSFAPGDLISEAYMLRLAPIVLFNLAICTHLLILILSEASKEKLIRWSAIFLFTSACLILQLPFLHKGFIASPILFVSLFFLGFRINIHNIHNIGSRIIKKERNRWTVKPFFITIGILLAYIYFTGATTHSIRINTDPSRTDQGAYMDFAKKVNDTNFKYTGDRNRMPLYPFIQSLFYEQELSDKEFFGQGKLINIYLSLICLGVLFLVFRKFLPSHETINLTLIVAFSVYIFKSAYFQSELLFYTINFLSFVLMGLLLIRPNLKLSILAGLMIGLAYLIKASCLPGLILFIIVSFLKLILTKIQLLKEIPNSRFTNREFLIGAGSLGLVGISFLGVIFPYILESKLVYGRFFYNVNSTFYIWYDSWEEAKKGTRAYGDRLGWPNLPPEEIPSFQKYVREHTPSQIMERLSKGLKRQLEIIQNQYGFFNYPVLYSSYLIILVMLYYQKSIKLTKKYFPLVIYYVLYFSVYILLFAWYTPINTGARFTYLLFAPFMFAAFVAFQKLTDESHPVNNSKLSLRLLPFGYIVNYLTSILLIVDIYFVLTNSLFLDYYGS